MAGCCFARLEINCHLDDWSPNLGGAFWQEWDWFGLFGSFFLVIATLFRSIWRD
jgi:hypothetical protein